MSLSTLTHALLQDGIPKYSSNAPRPKEHTGMHRRPSRVPRAQLPVKSSSMWDLPRIMSQPWLVQPDTLFSPQFLTRQWHRHHPPFDYFFLAPIQIFPPTGKKKADCTPDLYPRFFQINSSGRCWMPESLTGDNCGFVLDNVVRTIIKKCCILLIV